MHNHVQVSGHDLIVWSMVYLISLKLWQACELPIMANTSPWHRTQLVHSVCVQDLNASQCHRYVCIPAAATIRLDMLLDMYVIHAPSGYYEGMYADAHDVC